MTESLTGWGTGDEKVRSEAEIEDVKELFTGTGDEPPAINTAVRDTLTWVLGGVSTAELMEEYLVMGGDFHCFTCPAGWSGETGARADPARSTVVYGMHPMSSEGG